MKFDKVEFIYNSNAIEGYVFPKEEIRKALDRGKTDNPHIMGQIKALEYANKIIHSQHPLTSQVLKDIHIRLMHELLKTEEVGKFREHDVTVGSHTPPNWKNLKPLINDLIYAINAKKDPWICHCEFECIHPFADGNGRAGRILLYIQEAIQNIEPRIILNDDKQKSYYDLLTAYETKRGPELWQIKIWRKILKRNELLVCTSCGESFDKIIDTCIICGRSDKFIIRGEISPFGEPIIP